MQVRDVMTSDPACCAPETPIREAAKLMSDCDCGEIPVLDEAGKPIGVVTDRDIACRAVAQDKSPDTPVREVMSQPVLTASPDMSLDDCFNLMEDNQVRRLPVVDGGGACCGMVSQADVARAAPEDETAKLLRDVSRPTAEPSRVGCC